MANGCSRYFHTWRPHTELFTAFRPECSSHMIKYSWTLSYSYLRLAIICVMRTNTINECCVNQAGQYFFFCIHLLPFIKISSDSILDEKKSMEKSNRFLAKKVELILKKKKSWNLKDVFSHWLDETDANFTQRCVDVKRYLNLAHLSVGCFYEHSRDNTFLSFFSEM